jgi:hypothetical protein
MEARRIGADHVELLRRWVLGVLALGLAGTVTELVLLEHYEQLLQFVPLVLIVAAVAAIAWQVMRNVAGFAGIAAHFRGSAEFQLDLNPSMTAWELVEKVIRGQGAAAAGPRDDAADGVARPPYVYSDVR